MFGVLKGRGWFDIINSLWGVWLISLGVFGCEANDGLVLVPFLFIDLALAREVFVWLWFSTTVRVLFGFRGLLTQHGVAVGFGLVWVLQRKWSCCLDIFVTPKRVAFDVLTPSKRGRGRDRSADSVVKLLDYLIEERNEKKEEGREETTKGSRKKMLGRKRVGKEQQHESSKKQKVEEEKESDTIDEYNEAELKKILVIKKDEDIAIDAIPLATKLPVIMDYKLHKVANGSSKRYSSMIRMLQGIDKEDLEALWKIVKTKYSDKRPEDEFKRMLWEDLKVMFEPDKRSDIQKMNIKFKGGLLGLKRLHGFLEVTAAQCDDLLVKLNESKFKAATYKKGLATLEEQIITYKKNEVLFSEEVAVLKRELGCKNYEINVLKSELEKVNPPPHPLIYNRPNKLDLSYSGLDEFKEPEFKGYGPENSKQESNVVCEKESENSKENSDESLVIEQGESEELEWTEVQSTRKRFCDV
ncbi:hypothetical protein Tco_0678954 [Tanacetum coccineum]|uniref:Uncharacterized protein n=1 Tax=Tanacetum coccineum TaxID=301880 RepID=A0ABQ4XHS1_9ASTR